MIIHLTDVKSTLLTSGLDILSYGAVDSLSARLSTLTNYLSWGYVVDEDRISIEITDGQSVPNLSSIGVMET